MIRTFRKAALLKIVSWLVLSPPLAMAADNLHVAQSPSLQKLYDKAAVTFLSDHEKQEFSYTIDRNGTESDIKSNHDWTRSVVTVDNDTVAVVHTHPNGVSPEPSPGDRDAATNNGIDVYTLSQHELWVAHPYAKRAEKVGEVIWEHGHIRIK
jgi:proteasome lid subunit RPN8/RPN11